ncbi:hypothetical protein Ahy_A07g032818 [Arachis hypogaea]|uniref:Replication protein A 70 kDa DNA-binding subunit B/D first OB fold domain-containing protein n=1 Tax=Arachis hypogaea TaxID=3818 RepID=A0A445C7M0_ARAHY|nr:hypothetical protein Ahy_A07g032818 [Arachis hypogaea]
MLLMDENRDKIQATIKDHLISSFSGRLKEGNMYIISNLTVLPNTGARRVTKHRFELIFQYQTSVVESLSFSISDSGFSLYSIEEILQQSNDHEFLIDFIGILTCVERQKDVECDGKMIKVVIIELYADRIDNEECDWKLIRNIKNLKANSEDGEFFVIGKIKAVIDDPDWWFFSYICGHPVVGDDGVFHCQLCSRDVDHIIVRYRMKLVIEDGTSAAIFVLMDNVATKLFGKTCSDCFLQLEQEIEALYDYTIPVRIVSEFINKKLLFVVDARIVGYELNTSLHVVNSVCDDISFVNFLEDAAAIYDHKLFNLDGETPHIPLEKSYGVHMYSDSLNNAISNSSYISCNGSPISVLKSNVWLDEDNNYCNIKISNDSDKVEDTTLGSLCLS